MTKNKTSKIRFITAAQALAPSTNGKHFPVVRAQSFAEVQAACVELIPVPVLIGKKIVEISVRPLNEIEQEQLATMLSEVRPPLVKDENTQGANTQIPKDQTPKTSNIQHSTPNAQVPRYDTMDAEYQKQVGEYLRMARSLALYWCCPILNEEARKTFNTQHSTPNIEVADRNSIHNFVRGVWSEHVKQALWEVIQSNPQTLEELINFTSPPDSIPS